MNAFTKQRITDEIRLLPIKLILTILNDEQYIIANYPASNYEGVCRTFFEEAVLVQPNLELID